MIETHLAEIEEIKQLKARYCRLLDTKQWDAWRDVFVDDFTGIYELPPNPASEFSSADAIVETNKVILRDAETTHQVFSPEIEIGDGGSAGGVWAMFDFVRLPAFAFKGYGHYHDRYLKCTDGQWRIVSTHLTRLQVERFSGDQ